MDHMQANFAEALKSLNNTSEATNTMKCDAVPSSPASQNQSHFSINRMGAVRQFACSLPLDASDNSISNYHSSPPETNTDSEGAPVEGLLPWELAIFGDLLDEDFTSFTPSSQVHESRPHANTTPAQEWGGNYNVELGPPIQALYFPIGFQHSTPQVPMKVPTATQPSDNSGSGRGQLVNPQTFNDSDGNSNDSRVPKAKKKHQCTEYRCGKKFGRSAELKRHMNSVHRSRIANEKRQKLLSCPHKGCTRVGEVSGFKRKDNLVQHLRGVHGDVIGKKNGRRSAAVGRSLELGVSNTGAGSSTIPIGNDYSFHSQQEPSARSGQQQMMQGELGSPQAVAGFYESPGPSVSNTSVGSPTIPFGNDYSFHSQQEPPAHMDQQQMMQEEELGSPPMVAEFYKSLQYWSEEE
ncbi:hypothetical protein HOY80DRAFT_550850 [Tuber brumale]|nr:hypothetical protein HOY80DRAFT_550850 [Tuber brumale]